MSLFFQIRLTLGQRPGCCLRSTLGLRVAWCVKVEGKHHSFFCVTSNWVSMHGVGEQVVLRIITGIRRSKLTSLARLQSTLVSRSRFIDLKCIWNMCFTIWLPCPRIRSTFCNTCILHIFWICFGGFGILFALGLLKRALTTAAWHAANALQSPFSLGPCCFKFFWSRNSNVIRSASCSGKLVFIYGRPSCSSVNVVLPLDTTHQAWLVPLKQAVTVHMHISAVRLYFFKAIYVELSSKALVPCAFKKFVQNNSFNESLIVDDDAAPISAPWYDVLMLLALQNG